jgi:hypothetical protein
MGRFYNSLLSLYTFTQFHIALLDKLNVRSPRALAST